MSNENGNGEVKKLVDLKHAYNADLAGLEEDLQAHFDQELATGTKVLKDKYLEQVVDWFYSNGANGHAAEPLPAPAVASEPTPEQPPVYVAGPAAVRTEDMVPINPSGEPDKFPLKQQKVMYGRCPECNAPIWEPNAQFCSNCASPVTPNVDARVKRWARTQRR